MEALYWLEQRRTSLIDELMLLITALGEETVFMAVAIIVFWCVDKYKGYLILVVGFFGTLANQFMKMLFRIPRPWVLDPEFSIVEQAREAATGYSFPSGHTQNAVGTFGTIAAVTRDKAVRIAAIVVAVLVPVSRMYLGVHTPLDVLVAAAMALALVFALKPLVLGANRKAMAWLLASMVIASALFTCYMSFYPFPPDTDPHNLASGLENAYTLSGALLGLVVVYIVDEKWLHFPVKAVYWAQILKAGVGLALILGVKAGLKAPLNLIFGETFGRGIRYFLLVIVAGILWPLTFGWFSKLGKKG